MKCKCGQAATVAVTVDYGPGKPSTTTYTCDTHEPRDIPDGALAVRAETLP